MTSEKTGEDASTEPLERAQGAIDEARAAADRAEDVIGDPDGGWEADPAGVPDDGDEQEDRDGSG